MKLFVGIIGIVLGFTCGNAFATTYEGANFYAVLVYSDVIVTGTVLETTETSLTIDSKYGPRTALFRIDEVLSGTLSKGSTVQIYREYLRGLAGRNAYETGEQLCICLTTNISDRRGIPFRDDMQTYQIIGGVGEGEFPIVDGRVWIRKGAGPQEEFYHGEKMRPVKLPLAVWQKLVHDLQKLPHKQWKQRMGESDGDLITGIIPATYK